MVADLVETKGINPTSAANAQALAVAMALRMAMKNLEDLVVSLDIKLDRLLQDARTREMGNVRGITHVLSKSYGVFEETGKITATSWDPVTTHATELTQSHAVALEHIESLTVGLSARSLKKKQAAAGLAAGGELQHWLVLTAVCLANLARMDALELAHAKAHDEASVASHSAQIKRASDERRAETQQKVQALADAVVRARREDTLDRVVSPLAAARTDRALEKIQRLHIAFSEAFGMTETSEGFQRRAWHDSVMDLAQGIGNGVASAPRAVGTAVEDSVLGLAEQIRFRPESDSERLAAGSDDSVQPEVEPGR